MGRDFYTRPFVIAIKRRISASVSVCVCACVVPENCDSLGVIYWMLVFDAVFGFKVRWSIGGGLVCFGIWGVLEVFWGSGFGIFRVGLDGIK